MIDNTPPADDIVNVALNAYWRPFCLLSDISEPFFQKFDIISFGISLTDIAENFSC